MDIEYIRIRFEFAGGLTDNACEQFLRAVRESGGAFRGDSGIEIDAYNNEPDISFLREVELTEAARLFTSEHLIRSNAEFPNFEMFIDQHPNYDSNESSALTISEAYYPFEECDGIETWKDRTRSFLDVIGALANASEPTLGYGGRGAPLEYTVSPKELNAEHPAILSNVNLWGPSASDQLDLPLLQEHCFYVQKLDSGHVLFVVRPLTEWVNSGHEPDKTLADALDLEFPPWL